jgi:predicted nucleic acid-binding protein
MKKLLVDTNILVDLFTGNENYQKAKVALLDSQIFVSHPVVYELSILLKNRLGVVKSCEILSDFFYKSKLLTIIYPSIDEELKALYIIQKYKTDYPHKDFSLADAVQLAQATNHKLILYTTDERMTFYDQNKAKVENPYLK